MALISISRELVEEELILEILNAAGYSLTELRQEEPRTHRYVITGEDIPAAARICDIEITLTEPLKYDKCITKGPNEYYLRMYWRE